MDQFSNRLEQELLQFKSREERLGKMFPSGEEMNRSITEDKIKYFSYLLSKFKATRDPDEVYLLKRIQVQRRILEKELYPDKLLLLMKRIFHFLTADKRSAASSQIAEARNYEKLFDAVFSAGFKIPKEKIVSNMVSGRDQFTIGTSNYVNEKQQMEYQLVFVKDNSGACSFEGFKAALRTEGSPESLKEHFFKSDQGIFSPQEAFHLLSGRALEKNESWLQFDLTDRDAAGCYRIKEFHSDYGFDLKNVIEALPLKDKSSGRIDELVNALKNGETQSAVFCVKDCECSFLIAASPQFKTVDLYDSHLKKINLSTLRARDSTTEKRKTSLIKNVNQKKKKAVSIH